MNLRFKSLPAAFSLPEVTLAVAIAALGILSILGLMPQGLEMSRKTGQIAAHRSIVEQIIRDLDQTDWAQLPPDVQKKFFDDQGVELLTSNAPMISYVVQYIVDPTSPNLPNNGVAELNLKKVIIKIATTTNVNFDFGETNAKNYNVFHHYLAKGKEP